MKIDHINIVVTNLEEAEEFFVDLGFVPKKQASLEGEWIETRTVIVASGASARWLGLEPAFGRLFGLSTGTVSTLGWDRDNPVVDTWNEACHLADMGH